LTNPWQIPSKEIPSKGEKKKQRKRSQLWAKKAKPKVGRSLRHKGTNHVSKLSLVPRSISEKKGYKKLEKTKTSEKFSLAPSHLKIKVA
jgi:hypothetical protein